MVLFSRGRTRPTPSFLAPHAALLFSRPVSQHVCSRTRLRHGKSGAHRPRAGGVSGGHDGQQARRAGSAGLVGSGARLPAWDGPRCVLTSPASGTRVDFVLSPLRPPPALAGGVSRFVSSMCFSCRFQGPWPRSCGVVRAAPMQLIRLCVFRPLNSPLSICCLILATTPAGVGAFLNVHEGPHGIHCRIRPNEQGIKVGQRACLESPLDVEYLVWHAAACVLCFRTCTLK